MKHLTTPSGQQKGNTMKEFKEFIKELNISASLESIVTFFVDNEWFNENIVMEHGKIMLSDIQIEHFTNVLLSFADNTYSTLYEQFSTKFPETARLFDKFIHELNTGKETINEEFRYHLTDFMLYRLTKDLFLYTDIELEKLISHATFDLIKAHGDAFTFFLSWMKSNYKTTYQKDYVLSNRYTMDIQKQAYSFDDYIQLLYYLFVDDYIQDNNMLQKAADSKNYTDTWLYLALHFIRPLRLTDMERIYHPLLPYSAEEVLEKIKNDTFTNNDARGVLLSVTKRMSWLPLTPNKTESSGNIVPITFDIPTSCEVLIGKLFALAQAHRNIIGKPEEPIIRKINTYQEISRYMGEEIGDLFLHNDFRSRSATKSFLQDICMIADENESLEGNEIHVKGYYLAALARSHKGSYGDFAQTTFEYLKDAKLNNLTPEFVAFELLERGVFSFMASLLLKMALGEKFNRLTPQKQTKIIKTMDLSPKEIESVVTIVDNNRQVAQKLLNELITDETDILSVLHRIGSGEAFSKQRDCSCLMSALQKSCPYGQKRLCIGCEYDICTRSTLFLMVTEYNRIKNLFLSSEDSLEKAKYKNILQNIVLPKMDEMLTTIRELYGENVFNDYETLIKENT